MVENLPRVSETRGYSSFAASRQETNPVALVIFASDLHLPEKFSL
jgi:hypothetical protein